MAEKIILIGDVILQIIQLMCSRLVNANLVLAHSTKNSTRGGEELKISKTETVSRPQVLTRSEKIILIGEVIIQYLHHRYYLTMIKLFLSVTSFSR